MLLTNQATPTLYLDIDQDKLLLQFYEKGEEIPLIDTGFWQVYRGVVQLSRIYAEGEEVILGWATANTAFSNLNSLGNSSIDCASALSDCYLRWLSPQDLERYPSFAGNLVSQLSRRLITAEQLLALTGLRRVEERLWQLLLLLSAEMGQQVADGTRITIRFTHHNLAKMICTTRVTVTRILGDFQSRGLIIVDQDRHLIVKNWKNISK